jgi:SAM-dependent methyltransferase
MDRRIELLRYVTRQQRGIEIAPWFNPVVPKRAGYRTLILDLFDAQNLRRNAESDANVPKEMIPNIEEVDLVGSATDIAELVDQRDSLGSFDWVISSHNFEHLPNPIRFLQGCEKVLKPGGTLSMAIPDRRACFDYFRPHSTTADFMEAFSTRRERPSAAQFFLQHSLHSRLMRDGCELLSFSLDDDPACIEPLETLEETYRAWEAFEQKPDAIHQSVHCWAFTPASLELILRDLWFLGLIDLEIRQITPPKNGEFYVHLRNMAGSAAPKDRLDFYRERARILHSINNEAAEHTVLAAEHTVLFADLHRRLEENSAAYIGQLARDKQRIAELEAVLDALQASRSWRITAPLRALSSALCRAIGRTSL